ncbi:MAG TPA: methyltransferase domain-containing protein [Candidatus Hydrogenedentes bacterium]|jgi:2-polyprenyl-3-methyl-5-hydroxy-6-metoxy-1,4-benzoquinol methylase|nr:methyltransferase domain-containing protein [Candidatus Hydrogenedentota bacterium]
MSDGDLGSFERIAQYYEALANAPKRLEREGPFLRDLLSRAPGKRVLDVACGTGLHALWFAEQNAEVTAVDLSEGMIAYARTHRAHERIEYQVCDMRKPPHGTWDLILSLGNSLCLLNAEDELRQVFDSIQERLSPGGQFVFQVLNYERKEALLPRHRIETAGLPGGQLTAIKNLVPAGNRTLLALAFFVENASGRFETATDTSVLRNWTKDDLLSLALENALEPAGLFGRFSGEPFMPDDSPDLIVVLRKA